MGKPRNTRKYPTYPEIPEIPGNTQKKKRYPEIPDRIFRHSYPTRTRPATRYFVQYPTRYWKTLLAGHCLQSQTYHTNNPNHTILTIPSISYLQSQPYHTYNPNHHITYLPTTGQKKYLYLHELCLADLWNVLLGFLFCPKPERWASSIRHCYECFRHIFTTWSFVT